MDRITKSVLNGFQEQQEIKDKEYKAFEHFCNFTLVANQHSKTFSLEKISTGNGLDTGIDGIGFIVNGHLIEDEDEIQDLVDKNGYIEAKFLFIQSKTSTGLDSGEVLKFFNGLSDFFSEKPSLPRNEEIKKFSELYNAIYERASKFKEDPELKVFFVTNGTPQKDEHLESIVNQYRKSWSELNLFQKVEIEILGSSDIRNLYRKMQNPISSNFIFADKVTLPVIEGVEQSYYGMLPFKEFKKILIDENDNLLNVFDDNVRDYQGNNPVNSEIFKTLSGTSPDLFSVLNNGVTVVADSIKTSGNKITITDYQIVNGCQTSNVLFEKRNEESIDGIYIPIRLIVTQDSDLKSRITISTNNQTVIKKEQLTAMSDFQKNLESYYCSRFNELGLYYERRSKQYASNPEVVKRRVITIANQVKAYSSMFRQDPHMVTTYFGKLTVSMRAGKSGLCDAGDAFAPYYMAGLAYYKLDMLFSSKIIDKRFKKVKFYLLMLVLMVCSKDEIPPRNSEKKHETFCKPIIERLLNEENCVNIFKRAAEIIERSGAEIDNKQALKSKAMTEIIIAAFREADRI